MKRIAALDAGTNSVKITIAEARDGEIFIRDEKTEITRLGKGVDKTKRLDDAAMRTTLDAIKRFVADARAEGVEQIAAVGTSALRDASNGQEFLDRVKRETGIDIEIISGNREAHLAYRAVQADKSLHLGDGAVAVFDVGGGSTEINFGHGGELISHQSLDIGAVRLTERLIKTDPPTIEELAEAGEQVDALLAKVKVPDNITAIAGIGGTAVNIAAVLNQCCRKFKNSGHSFDDNSVKLPISEQAIDLKTPVPNELSTTLVLNDGGEAHGATVTEIDTAAVLTRLAAEPLEERRNIVGLEPARADVIIAGIVIVQRLLVHVGVDRFTVSTRGLRFGLLSEMV